MEKKQKATSTSYALKAFRGHLLTLWERQLMSEEDYQTVLGIYKQIVQEWFKKDFGDEGEE